jgi:hypothetical protein
MTQSLHCWYGTGSGREALASYDAVCLEGDKQEKLSHSATATTRGLDHLHQGVGSPLDTTMEDSAIYYLLKRNFKQAILL